MKKPFGLRNRNEFGSINPLGSEPMGGIEQFTIRRVGNPVMDGEKVNAQLAKALFLGMHGRIKKRVTSRGRKHSVKYQRVIYEPKLVAKISSVGTVEMGVVSAARFETVSRVCDILVNELFESCEQNSQMVMEVFDLFWTRVAQQEYKAPELMSTLLVCVEEKRVEMKYGGVVENKPRPIPMLDFSINRVGKGDGEVGTRDISIKIVSIREMLRNYFEKYPSRYREAVEKVVGVRSIGAKSIEHAVQEKIERIGVWEFAVRIWMQIRQWDCSRPLEGGIISPIDDEQKWILCPRWRGNRGSLDVGKIASIIAEHYSKSI